MKEVGARLLLLVGSVVASVALFEIVIHAIEARRGPLFPGGPRTLGFTEEHPLLGWRHASDVVQRYGWPEHPEGVVTIRTNGLGLREDTPTATQPSVGVTRVLALGDSHTDGLVDNDESWPNVLERTALERGLQWEVLNAGVTGYQPIQYYLWWRTFGRDLEPDLVLLAFYLGNDLIGAAGSRLARGADGSWRLDESVDAPAAARGGVRALLDQFRRHCRSCALVSLIAHTHVLGGPTFEEAGYVRGDGEQERLRYLSALRRCLGCVWQSLDQPWLLRNDPAEYRFQLDATEELLRRMSQEVRLAGARLVVIVIPSKLQVEPHAAAVARETATLMGLDGLQPLFEDRLEADVLLILERLGIDTIRVGEALGTEHERSGSAVYYEADWHLNVLGSRVVGAEVARELTRASGPEPGYGRPH